MARSVYKGTTPPPIGGLWYNSTAYPGWYWKGDTSSDEVTGHMLVCYEFSLNFPEMILRCIRWFINYLLKLLMKSQEL